MLPDGNVDFVKVSRDYKNRRHRDAGGGVVIHEDTMSDTWNPVDGGIYNSKSTMVKNNRARGCYELGNDYVTPEKQERDRLRRFNCSSLEKKESFKRAFQRAYKEGTGKTWV